MAERHETRLTEQEARKEARKATRKQERREVKKRARKKTEAEQREHAERAQLLRALGIDPGDSSASTEGKE
jgi:hypothetical protein